jgi:plasmid stability protein
MRVSSSGATILVSRSQQWRCPSPPPDAIREKVYADNVLRIFADPAQDDLNMCCTCEHVFRMGMIQIRNVPDDLHRRLKARAATIGLTLSEMLLREARRVADTPTREEFLARLAKLTPPTLDISPADAIREERDSR